MLRGLLRQEGCAIGRRQVATLMRRMGIDVLYLKPSPSRSQSSHQIYPYLLRDLPDLAAESRLSHEHCLHPHVARLRVFVRCARLGQSPVVGVAVLQQANDQFLSRGGSGRHRLLWPAGDIQYRSRVPIYQTRVHRAAGASQL